MPPIPYSERVNLTVESQLKRAEANQLFRDGNLQSAVVAYEEALRACVLDEDQLPLLSNLGFCHLKLNDPAEACKRLLPALALGSACFKNPVLAAKVSGRFLEACRRLGDAKEERRAIADCHFYISVATERHLTPPSLSLPLPPAESITELLMAIGECEDTECDAAAKLPTLLHQAGGGESMDEHRMHALARSPPSPPRRAAAGRRGAAAQGDEVVRRMEERARMRQLFTGEREAQLRQFDGECAAARGAKTD